MIKQRSSICCVAPVSTDIKDAVTNMKRVRVTEASLRVTGPCQSSYTSTSEQNSAVIQFVIKIDIKFAKIHISIHFFSILDMQILSKYLKR